MDKNQIQNLIIEKRIRLHYGLDESFPMMITFPKETSITIEQLEIIKQVDKKTFTDVRMFKC